MPRPETELLAGWAVDAGRPVSTSAGRRRPVHRLRRDRQGAWPTRSRRPRARRRAGRGTRTRWASATWPAPASTCGSATSADGVPRARRHRRRRGRQPAVHPARGLGVGRRRGPRPRPAPSRCGPATTAWTRSAWSRPRAARLLAARGSGRGRARRRAGRVRAGGVRGHRAVGRRPRPPRPGRPSAVRDRPAGTMSPCRLTGRTKPWTFRSRTSRPTSRRRAGRRAGRRADDEPTGPADDDRLLEAARALAAASLAVQRGELVVLPTDTVYGIGADAFDADAVQSAARRQGPRPRDAAAGADRLGDHARRAGDRRHRLRPPARRPLLARAADAGVPPAAVPAVGPRRHPRHGRGADARPPGRPRAARAHRPDGGQQREPHRPAGRHRRRRGRGDARRPGRGDPRRRPVTAAARPRRSST